jgi:hypothetical protein
MKRIYVSAVVLLALIFTGLTVQSSRKTSPKGSSKMSIIGAGIHADGSSGTKQAARAPLGESSFAKLAPSRQQSLSKKQAFRTPLTMATIPSSTIAIPPDLIALATGSDLPFTVPPVVCPGTNINSPRIAYSPRVSRTERASVDVYRATICPPIDNRGIPNEVESPTSVIVGFANEKFLTASWSPADSSDLSISYLVFWEGAQWKGRSPKLIGSTTYNIPGTPPSGVPIVVSVVAVSERKDENGNPKMSKAKFSDSIIVQLVPPTNSIVVTTVPDEVSVPQSVTVVMMNEKLILVSWILAKSSKTSNIIGYNVSWEAPSWKGGTDPNSPITATTFEIPDPPFEVPIVVTVVAVSTETTANGLRKTSKASASAPLFIQRPAPTTTKIETVTQGQVSTTEVSALTSPTTSSTVPAATTKPPTSCAPPIAAATTTRAGKRTKDVNAKRRGTNGCTTKTTSITKR